MAKDEVIARKNRNDSVFRDATLQFLQMIIMLWIRYPIRKGRKMKDADKWKKQDTNVAINRDGMKEIHSRTGSRRKLIVAAGRSTATKKRRKKMKDENE